MELKDIKQILIDQKEELEDSLKGKKIIEREVLGEYKKSLKSSLIKIITGPRRAGKSVLGYEMLKDKNFAYVNFDDERLFTLETKDLNLVLQTIYEIYQKPDFIFLDEIQNVNNWELF
ncbi:MAG: AAA family ATPase, partial [bacterium]